MNDIVVGVDQSDTARTAATTAATLAATCGTNLHIVMCVKRASSQEVAVGGDRWRLDSLSEAESFLNDLRRTLPHDRITSTVAFGDPAATMCEEAQRLGARMIVVGNRRVQGASRILGSIAADVTRHACCDVLIANTTAA
jgi:nucleotide-binding universal stress UspA family protein